MRPEPKRPRDIELIEKLDRMALPRQGKRRRKPGRAASGNGDGERLQARTVRREDASLRAVRAPEKRALASRVYCPQA